MTTDMGTDPRDWPLEREHAHHCTLWEYAEFMDNANRWLHQAARGEVPSLRCMNLVGQLLPCPFCGCEAKYKAFGHDGKWAFHQVECQSCGVTQMMFQKSSDEVIRRWNARRVDVSHLQLMATKAGFQYWRASDAHGVKGTKEQAELFIADLIGVEVEICLPNADFTGPTTGPAPETGVAGSGANPC